MLDPLASVAGGAAMRDMVGSIKRFVFILFGSFINNILQINSTKVYF